MFAYANWKQGNRRDSVLPVSIIIILLASFSFFFFENSDCNKKNIHIKLEEYLSILAICIYFFPSLVDCE